MKHWKIRMVLFTLVLALAFAAGEGLRLCPAEGLADHRGIDCPAQSREEGRRPGLAACGNQFWRTVAAHQRAVKFNEVRTTLNTKMSNAHSYLVLAGASSSTANSLYQPVRTARLIFNMFSHVSKKPFVAWYYADANVAIAREVKHCYKLYASVAASGINLMKASMDEKHSGDDAQSHHRQGPLS